MRPAAGSVAVVMIASGLCLGGCGRLGDVIDRSITARDCHPDPETVAALRLEPVLAQAPPGATLGAVTLTVSCGWDDPLHPNLGMLDAEVTRAGTADDVSRFYAGLARSSGWQEFGQGDQVYFATKSDGTGCSWSFQVRGIAVGSYHLQIGYTPRDVRPSCI